MTSAATETTYSNSATWLCLLVRYENMPLLWRQIMRTIQLLQVETVLLLRLTKKVGKNILKKLWDETLPWHTRDRIIQLRHSVTLNHVAKDFQGDLPHYLPDYSCGVCWHAMVWQRTRTHSTPTCLATSSWWRKQLTPTLRSSCCLPSKWSVRAWPSHTLPRRASESQIPTQGEFWSLQTLRTRHLIASLLCLMESLPTRVWSWQGQPRQVWDVQRQG